MFTAFAGNNLHAMEPARLLVLEVELVDLALGFVESNLRKGLAADAVQHDEVNDLLVVQDLEGFHCRVVLSNDRLVVELIGQPALEPFQAAEVNDPRSTI